MSRELPDRVLLRWLATGRPARVTRLIDADPSVAARLDKLSALAPAESNAIDELVEPALGFEQRTEKGVKSRLDSFGAASTFLDLLGLGYHAGRAILGADSYASGEDDDELEGGC